MDVALDTWRKNDNPEPVEDVLKSVRHAVGLFIVRDIENGERTLSEEDKHSLHDYLEPYLAGE